MWLAEYETPDFRAEIAGLWDQLTPLYEQLHAFVRGRLREQYGRKEVSRTSPIPASLLGKNCADDGGLNGHVSWRMLRLRMRCM